jgi:hypothetical protein
MDILEMIKDKDTQVPAGEVVEDKFSNILCRLADLRDAISDETQKAIVESVRGDVTRLRSTVRKFTGV